MKELEQAGNFRGQIVEYGADEAESGAVAVGIRVKVEEIFHENEWHDWREHDFCVRGKVWVVKKDGTVNARQAESLIGHAGWDGTFDSITAHSWQPTPISFTVDPDVYNGETRYRIGWINSYESTPGGGGNIDASKSKALDSKLGSQLRALAANQSRNGAVPTQKPGKPTALGVTPASDEVPF